MVGRKLPLGFVETTTENSEGYPSAEAIKGLFWDWIGRDLSFEKGLLCVLDGAKGLFKAVCEVVGGFAEVQRCRWHPGVSAGGENVVSYLAKKDQAAYRRRLQKAYQQPDYPTAKAALMQIHTRAERAQPQCSPQPDGRAGGDVDAAPAGAVR